MRISDWSSDVCSSDLYAVVEHAEIARAEVQHQLARGVANRHRRVDQFHPDADLRFFLRLLDLRARPRRQRPCRSLAASAPEIEIGRAPCRERVCQYV